jgi:beta-glucosidase
LAKIYASKSPAVSEREIRNGQRSRELAPQGMVLLENNGALPLEGKPGKIALYGNGARRTIKGGTGSGDVNSRETVNIEQGLEDAGFTIVTKDWIDRDCRNFSEAEAAYFERLRKMFSEKGFGAFAEMFENPFIAPSIIPIGDGDLRNDETDTAVFVISRNSGEGKDRNNLPGEYDLFTAEIEGLRKVAAAYATTIVVLNVGSVIDMKALKAIEGVDAILNMSQAGNYGGYALADVLIGKQGPSGHLATTWAVNYEDYPSAATFSHCNGDTDDEYYTEGIYVGYRYFDTFNLPVQYPFGYGLTYTTFDLECTGCEADEKEVNVRVRVTNTGRKPGRQTVQVYVSAPEGILEKPYQGLAGYAKTRELAPGASETVTVRFAVADLASYDPGRAAWILEPGTYYVRAGIHSRDTKVVLALQLDEEKVTFQVKNLLKPDCEMKLLSAAGVKPYAYPGEEDEKTAAPVIRLDAGKIETRRAVYAGPAAEIPKTDRTERITMADVQSGKATLDEMVSQLTPFEMATLCVGTQRGGMMENSGPQIGASSAACPGAAGDTTSLLLEDRGVRNLILPDGPAGLRLNPHFRVDGEGRIYMVDSPFPAFDLVAGGRPKPEIPADAVDYYQYTTAIPIATLLAQTWDDEAVEAAGDIVGGEMEEFGCDLWLAPGMNIHRNPLCGRNFEYYSEDPLIAGRCAAADTRGVQKHRSAGTTVKHFAFNNQEDNRNHVNSHVDERAIREIYLKGFEICIREAHPYSIMTSYNLINGEHTANSYDLINAFARDECGFDGIVMTDWGTTSTSDMFGETETPKHKYGNSFASGCIKAGNDLTMPGSENDVNDILNALGKKPGEVPYPLTLGELQAAAGRMLSLILRMGLSRD